MTSRYDSTGKNTTRITALCALILSQTFFSAASHGHASQISYLANIGADSIAAIETHLETSTGMDAIVTAYGTLDWATQGNGVGVSTSGPVTILIPDPPDLDVIGLPVNGYWEYSQAFPPDINYQVLSFDAGSPIGIQHALYVHDTPGIDDFSVGLFQTDHFTDGTGTHGWTGFSMYNVVLSAWNNGDLAPRGAPDGGVAAGDSLICQQILLKMITPTLDEVAHGDVHPIGAPDGIITAGDCLLIQQTALLQ